MLEKNDSCNTIDEFNSVVREVEEEIKLFQEAINYNLVVKMLTEELRYEELKRDAKKCLEAIIKNNEFISIKLGRMKNPNVLDSMRSPLNDYIKRINKNIKDLKSILEQKNEIEVKNKKEEEVSKIAESLKDTEKLMTKKAEEIKILEVLVKNYKTQMDEVKKQRVVVRKLDTDLRKNKEERLNVKGIDKKTRDDVLNDLMNRKATSTKSKEFIEAADDNTINRLAIFAITTKNEEIFDFILDGINVDYEGSNYKSLLTLSAENYKNKIFSTLLTNGAVPDDISLYACVEKQNEEGCQVLMQYITDLNSYFQKETKKSVLTYAVEKNSLKLCELFIEHIKIFSGTYHVKDILDYNGTENKETALYVAAKNGNVDICQLLLTSGVDINKRSVKEISPLEISIENGHENVTATLRANGAMESSKNGLYAAFNAIEKNDFGLFIKHFPKISDINAKNSEGYTLLQKSIIKNNLDIFNALINHSNLKINELCDNEIEINALFLATKYGYLKNSTAMCKSLLDKGASPDCVDDTSGESALMLAVQGHSRNKENVKLIATALKSKPALNNRRIDSGETALYIAAISGYADVCEILLDNGADINCGTWSTTPLAIAVQKNNIEVIQILAGRGADDKNLDAYRAFNAIEKGDITCLTGILSKININAMNGEGFTLLHCAVKNGNVDVCRLLLDNKVDINVLSNGRYLYSSYQLNALFFSVIQKNATICELLLAKGAQPDFIYSFTGESVLMFAVRNGCLKISELIVSALVKNGKNINYQCKTKSSDAESFGYYYYGETALYVAAKYGHAAICDLLIRNGSDISKGVGRTSPLDIAIENGHKEVVKILQQAESKKSTSIPTRIPTMM